MKKTVIKILIAALVLTGVGASGYYGYKKYTSSKKVTVSTSYINMTATKMNLQVNIQGTGAVYAANTKEITANNNGEIRDFNINVGDTIKKGDKIATVYSSSIEQGVTKASSNLQKQQTALNNSTSKQDIQLQNLAIQDAESELDSLLAQQQSLIDSGKEVSDQLKDSINKANSNLEKQKIQLQKLTSQSDNTAQKLAIQDAQTDLATAKDQLSKMTLTSPIDGLVISKTGQNGDNVQSAKSLLTIIDPSSYKIKVAVDELDIAKVKVGQKAQIKFGALKDKVYEGAVEQIALTGTTSNNVTTYDVVVSVQNPEGVMLGMNANVTINVNSKENALVVPIEAVTERNGKKYVMVPNTSTGVKSSSNADESKTQKSQSSTDNTSGERQFNSGSNTNSGNGNRQNSGRASGTNRQSSYQGGNAAQFSTGAGKLVEIKTGLENENYVEILEGISEGQKLLVVLPKSTTNTTNNRSNFGGMGGMSGGMGGNTTRIPGAGGGK